MLDDPPLCILAHIHRYLSAYDPARADTAAQYAQRAIEAGDQADDALVTLADVHAARGRRRRALEELEKSDRGQPVEHDGAARRRARARRPRRAGGRVPAGAGGAFGADPDDPFVAARYRTTCSPRRLGDYRAGTGHGRDRGGGPA